MHAALGDQLRLRIVEMLSLGDRAPQELARELGMETNLIAHHLGVLESAGVVERRVSWGDRRRRYVVLRRVALQSLGRSMPSEKARFSSIAFVCNHNSARSQFAEALMRQVSDVEIQSGGLDPAPAVHPMATRVAQEHGLDLSGQRPKPYSAIEGKPDLVVSVCDRAFESEIPLSGARLHWSVPDPVEHGRLERFRSVFEEIAGRVELLAEATEQRE